MGKREGRDKGEERVRGSRKSVELGREKALQGGASVSGLTSL